MRQAITAVFADCSEGRVTGRLFRPLLETSLKYGWPTESACERNLGAMMLAMSC